MTEPDLTVKQFAQITNQAEQSVYRQCRLGKIPSYRVAGSVRIRREDVEMLRSAPRNSPKTFVKRPDGALDGQSFSAVISISDMFAALTSAKDHIDNVAAALQELKADFEDGE
jgi:hypothetical protein